MRRPPDPGIGRDSGKSETATFAPGALVKARGREWVVLPESSDELLVLRPLGGCDDEIAGLLPALEEVHDARFALPDPNRPGDHLAARLLRDALRLGFRSSAGPFRSFGHLGFEPRPYQLVPLLMALRQETVRLLIADDVGIGKTIEAALVARELFDQGEIASLAVLCPPHLAPQWHNELRDKLHFDAELVLPSTAARLERDLGAAQSLFDVYPVVVVSTDFIKTDRRRTDFVRSAPRLVIVDEAHTCATDGSGRGRHQRHALVRDLAKDPSRHLILVTATPHSGRPEAFRSLCALLKPGFADLPDDLAGSENASQRQELARHLVQRRRADLAHYLGDETAFPSREEPEEAYGLTPDYRTLFDRVVEFAREIVLGAGESDHRRRIRWWSALALLRALASSPAAAAATLRTRAAVMDTESVAEADAVGGRMVLDLGDADEESLDVTPGSQTVGAGDEAEATETQEQRRLRELAKQADALAGDGDPKLRRAALLLQKLLDDGFQPIVFCRFIATAEYVGAELKRRLKKGVEVAAVTSTLPAPEREAQVRALGAAPRRLLVATDCLSEGINLQQWFDAVLHYDLSWNPTRHEQREGRVDRLGQASPAVRLVTYYGRDNPIDGIVLDVLVRKSREIRRSLGVTVPFPAANEAAEAIVEGVLLRRARSGQSSFEFMRPQQQELFAQWDRSVEREQRSRTVFAQNAIQVDEVRRELEEVRRAVGGGADVARFVETAVLAHGGQAQRRQGAGGELLRLDLRGTSTAVREALQGDGDELLARFVPPVGEGQLLLTRTGPRVERPAAHVLGSALDSQTASPARRCGVIRTRAVQRRTTLLLLRHRLHLFIAREGDDRRRLLAEDCGLAAFEGSPDAAEWLPPERAEALLEAEPSGNLPTEKKIEFVKKVIDGWPRLAPRVEELARARAGDLHETHRRVRKGAKLKGVRIEVEPELPPDVLGIFVFLPDSV